MFSPRALLALLLSLLLPAPALAALTVSAGPLTFDLPDGFQSDVSGPPPLVASWRSTRVPVAVYVLKAPVPNQVVVDEALSDVRKFSSGMARGFGNMQAQELSQALRVPCRANGMPLHEDAERLAVQVQVDVTCDTRPIPAQQRSFLHAVLTKAGTFIVRVDADTSAAGAAAAVAAQVWPSIEIDRAERIKPDHGRAIAWLVGLAVGLVAVGASGFWLARRRKSPPAAQGPGTRAA